MKTRINEDQLQVTVERPASMYLKRMEIYVYYGEQRHKNTSLGTLAREEQTEKNKRIILKTSARKLGCQNSK